MTLSLCRVLGVAFYFSKGFSEAAARVSAVAEALQPLGETIVCVKIADDGLNFYFSFPFLFFSFPIFRTTWVRVISHAVTSVTT